MPFFQHHLQGSLRLVYIMLISNMILNMIHLVANSCLFTNHGVKNVSCVSVNVIVIVANDPVNSAQCSLQITVHCSVRSFRYAFFLCSHDFM
jgi:hypothetical protein